jgi:PDZ domain
VALFVEPPIYWVNPVVPEVDGVVVNSPAYRAGVRAGDIIRSINEQPIYTRIQSEYVLDQCHLEHQTHIDLTVDRQGQEIAFQLEELPSTADTYPYHFDYFYRGENYGIFHVEDFHLRDIQAMFEVIQRYRAKNILLFSSAIAAPIFDQLVNHIPEFSEQLKDVNIFVDVVAENTLGGNYDVMDSRFVEDYAQVIRKRIQQGVTIDLILIPDAFGSSWGVDMTGASYTQISMELGIPVERIRWFLIYGREV